MYVSYSSEEKVVEGCVFPVGENVDNFMWQQERMKEYHKTPGQRGKTFFIK